MPLCAPSAAGEGAAEGKATAARIMTELIDPSPTVPAVLSTRIETELLRMVQSREYGGIALCGTPPPGAPAALYAKLATATHADTLLLLDAYKNVGAILRSGAGEDGVATAAAAADVAPIAALAVAAPDIALLQWTC